MPDYSLHFDPITGRVGRVSPTGSAVVSELKRLTGGGFAGSLDSTAWTANNSGTASAITIGNIATLNPGTDAAGYAAIQATNKARFLYASANSFRGTFRLNSLGGNSVNGWGAVNFGSLPSVADGYHFSYDGTNLGINTVNNGVVTTVAPNVTPFTPDTNAHNFEIIYQVAGVSFVIDSNLIHRISPKGSLLTSTPHFTCGAFSKNTTATQGNNLEVWAMSIIRYGAADSGTQAVNVNTLGTTTLKIGPGNLHRILINNLVSSNIITIYDSVTASGTKIATFSPTGNNSIPSFVDVDYDFQNGLTVNMSAATASNLTFVFD